MKTTRSFTLAVGVGIFCLIFWPKALPANTPSLFADPYRDNHETIVLSDTDLILRNVVAHQVSVMLPHGFSLLTDADMKVRYPMKSPGTMETWADSNAEVNFGFELTQNSATPERLPAYRDAFVRQFSRMKSVSLKTVKLIRMKGRDYIHLEIISDSPDGPVYNYMLLTALNGRLLICTFNCKKTHLSRWKETGRRVMHSIEIHD